MKTTKKLIPQTTQRVDLETLNRIKTIDLHLSRTGIRLTQSEIISRAINFTVSREADFIEYVRTGQLKPSESTFDMIVNLTGRPWFPYGNLI